MANRLPASNQRLPEILDGWHPLGGSQLETSYPEQTQGTPDQARKLRLGPRRGLGAPHPGRVRPSSSWLPELLRQGKAQNAGPTESALLWRNGKLELHATQGPLPIVDGESTHATSGGKTSVARILWALPTHASDICLQCPSLPTARLNKWT